MKKSSVKNFKTKKSSDKRKSSMNNIFIAASILILLVFIGAFLNSYVSNYSKTNGNAVADTATNQNGVLNSIIGLLFGTSANTAQSGTTYTTTPTTTPTKSQTPSPTNTAAPTPTGTGTPTPTQKVKNKCCYCFFWVQDDCKTRSWLNCKNKYSCEWRDGACTTMAVFKNICDQWLAAPEQKDCDRKESFPATWDIGSDGKPTLTISTPPGIETCTSIFGEYSIHGTSKWCYLPASLAQVCLNKVPGCSVNLDFSACLMFANIDDAKAYAEELQSQLGGDQCVTLSGNQCNDIIGPIPTGEQCPTRYTITVTAKSCTGTASTCQIGKKCTSLGNYAFCTDENGKIACEKCDWTYLGLGQNEWIPADNYFCERIHTNL